MKPKLVVLSGAGISAESGLKTFRDSNGLWEGHDVMSVASIQGWEANPQLVLAFYNQRRAQLKDVQPNYAHQQLAVLEQSFETIIITQNVDDLHERAGSSRVIHLHGELRKVRSVHNEELVYSWHEDLNQDDRGADGSALRPHIVWFGEAVPKMDEAVAEIQTADAVLIIGTSLQVYPAASLYTYAPAHAPVIYLDPKASLNASGNELHCIEQTAVAGIDEVSAVLKSVINNL